MFEASYAHVWEAIRVPVKRAIKSGDIRRDLDPIDLLRALIGVANVATNPDRQAERQETCGHLRRPLRRLGRYGSIDTAAATRLCRVTSPTARNYLGDLALLGIGALRKGRPASNQPNEVVLSEEYQWLRTSLTAPIHASDLEI